MSHQTQAHGLDLLICIVTLKLAAMFPDCETYFSHVEKIR